MASAVTREEFQIRSEVEVVHIPTGAVFLAYPYSNPDDMLQSVKVNWGRAGSPAINMLNKSGAWHRICCLSTLQNDSVGRGASMNSRAQRYSARCRMGDSHFAR